MPDWTILPETVAVPLKMCIEPTVIETPALYSASMSQGATIKIAFR
jgi:hypothetical protein